MGQNQTHIKQNQDYQLIEQLPVGNIVKHNRTQALHFLKQYSFTAQQAYQNALNMHSLRLANKNQQILNFLHFTTKSENSFCSTFHKIVLIFQYSDYTLEKQIAERLREDHPFNQKEIWSILCSCILGSVHLIRCEGKMHCGLSSRDIRLTSNKSIKILSHEMIGIDSSHSQSEGHPKMLVTTIIECIRMQKCTNQDSSYLEKTIQNLDCSRDMKQILHLMLKKDVTFLELQQHLFKLVQDDQSLGSHSNTPVLKSQSPLVTSGYKCPRINPNDNRERERNRAFSQQFQLKVQALQADSEDGRSYLYKIDQSTGEIENPDETEQQEGQQNLEQEADLQQSHKQINSFYLKDAKNKYQKSQSGQYSNMSKIFNKKEYEILPPLQSSRRNQENANQNNLNINSNGTLSANIEPPFKNEGNLFTDPKLFSLIRNDLQEIKMRRSNAEVTGLKKEQKNVNKSELSMSKNAGEIDKNANGNNFEHSNEEEQTSMETWFKQNSRKNSSQANSNQHNKRNFEMIRQVSQEYRQQDQERSERKRIAEDYLSRNEKQEADYKSMRSNRSNRSNLTGREGQMQEKSGQNIMSDNSIGFRKKKQLSGRGEALKQTLPNSYPNSNQFNIQTQLQSQSQNLRTKENMDPFKPESKSKFQHQKLKNPSFRNEESTTNIISQSQQSTSRIKQYQKLVQVSQKYTRGHYEGTKLNGKRHGFGTFFYSEGGKYVGNWKQNKMHGKGVLYYPSQKVAYDGQWENDQLSGYGTLYNEEVMQLRTPFDYRDWSDAQDYWVRYEGNFYQDNKEGKGKLFLVNGQRLEAQFHDDKVDGQGILYRGDSTSVKGKWRQNKLIKMF